MKTPAYGDLVHAADEILARVRGKNDLMVIKRTERDHDGIVYMVLVVDFDLQERTIWSYTLTWGGRRARPLAETIAREQDRVADEIWSITSVAA